MLRFRRCEFSTLVGRAGRRAGGQGGGRAGGRVGVCFRINIIVSARCALVVFFRGAMHVQYRHMMSARTVRALPEFAVLELFRSRKQY